MSIADRDALLHLFDYHVAHEYVLVAVTPEVIDEAYRLTQRHRLRGYDAVQLATALALNSRITAAGHSGVTLVASDTELLTAARTAGLGTDDPRLHP